MVVYDEGNYPFVFLTSEINNIKTKSRNKLITSTVNGALLARQAVKNQGGWTKFHASINMCKKMKSKEKYSLHKKDSEVRFSNQLQTYMVKIFQIILCNIF